jgi:hypothetical protein
MIFLYDTVSVFLSSSRFPFISHYVSAFPYRTM